MIGCCEKVFPFDTNFSTFVKLYLLPNFLERPILISKLISVLLSVRFYSFFFIRFSMNIGVCLTATSDKNFSRSEQPRRFAVEILTVLILSDLVGTSGLEPPTSRLSGARSNHLSYAPMWLCGVSRSLAIFSPIPLRLVKSEE